MATDITAKSGYDDTYWERVASRRWGVYITGIEKHAILLGQELAGPPTTAFEVGCDGGRWSKLLAELGWTMTCTDVNADALAVCHKRVPDARCILAKPGRRASGRAGFDETAAVH